MARDWACIACGKVGCCMDCVADREVQWYQQRKINTYKRVGREATPILGRKCEGCGKEMVPRPGEQIQNFNIKKSCNKVCANLVKRKRYLAGLGEKKCEWCGKLIKPLQPDGKLLAMREWNKRKYCSPECYFEAKRKKRSDEWKDRRKKAVCSV